jgi:hypothetical protein
MLRSPDFSTLQLDSVPGVYPDPVGALKSPFAPATHRSLSWPDYLENRHMTIKLFIIYIYEKYARNPFRMRIFKTQDLRPFRIRIYGKTPRGVGSYC